LPYEATPPDSNFVTDCHSGRKTVTATASHAPGPVAKTLSWRQCGRTGLRGKNGYWADRPIVDDNPYRAHSDRQKLCAIRSALKVDAIGLGSQSASIATGGAATRPRWYGSRRCRECRGAAGSPSRKLKGSSAKPSTCRWGTHSVCCAPSTKPSRPPDRGVRLIAEPDARPALLQAMSQIAAAPPP
jgi:hypothetical protein